MANVSCAYNRNMKKKFDGLELILFGCCLLLFAGFCLTKLKLDGEAEKSGESSVQNLSGVSEELSQEELVLREQEEYMQKNAAGDDTEAQETSEPAAQNTVSGNAAAQNEAESAEAQSASAEEPNIRVLIKTTDFAGYFHDRLVLKGNSRSI